MNSWKRTDDLQAVQVLKNKYKFVRRFKMGKINSLENLYKKYPMGRDEMTEEQERDFVQYSFDLYEKEGFARVFWSMGGDFAEYHNKPFTVVERSTEKECGLCCLPQWKITFEGGETFTAYPDEIIPSEMISNGCKIENLTR